MLKTRILTAVVLFLVFFSALFLSSPLAWVFFATLVAVVAAWEWGGVLNWRGASRIALGGAMAVFALGVAAVAPRALGLESGFAEAAWRLGRWFYLPAAAFWLLLVPVWMRQRWVLPKSVLGVIVGMLLVLPTWLALIQLRQAGAGTLVAIMAVAWVADSAAYFAGRSFGRHKLAPSISPGKTWEGALGGAVAVLVYGYALAPTLSGPLAERPIVLLPVLLLLTVLSVVGDLFESLLKRQAGLKDSSNVLPGHGGVLDRIDSLTSMLPLVALAWLCTLP